MKEDSIMASADSGVVPCTARDHDALADEDMIQCDVTRSVRDFMSESRRDIASYRDAMYVYAPCPDSLHDTLDAQDNPRPTYSETQARKHSCKCLFTKAQERGLVAGFVIGLILSAVYITWMLLDNRFRIRSDDVTFVQGINNNTVMYNLTIDDVTSDDVSVTGYSGTVRVIVKLRKPLFLGVLTQNKYLTTRGAACNATWAKSSYVTKMDFYTNVETSLRPDHFAGVTILKSVAADDYFHVQKTSLMIQRICSQHVASHDWFLLSTDDVYVRVDQLHAFIADKDPNKKWYAGHVTYAVQDAAYTLLGGEPYCSRGPGILLSRAALTGICDVVPECFSHRPVGALSPDVLLAKCLHDHVGVTCTGYNKLFVDTFEENEMSRLRHFLEAPEQTISVHPVKTNWAMHALHTHYTERSVRRLIWMIQSLDDRRKLLDEMTSLLSSREPSTELSFTSDSDNGIDMTPDLSYANDLQSEKGIGHGRKNARHVSKSELDRSTGSEAVVAAMFDDKLRIYKNDWCDAVQHATPALEEDLNSVMVLANASLQLGEGLHCPRMLSGDFRRHEFGASYSVHFICRKIHTPHQHVTAQVTMERNLKPITVKKLRKRKLTPDVIVIVATTDTDSNLFSYLLRLGKLSKQRHEQLAIYLLMKEENTLVKNNGFQTPASMDTHILESWWTGSHVKFRVFRETKHGRARSLQNLVQDVKTHFPDATSIVTDTRTHITPGFIVKCKTLARKGKQMYYPYTASPELNNNSREPRVMYRLLNNSPRPYCIHSSDLEGLLTPRDSLLSTSVRQKGRQLKVVRAVDFGLEVRLI